MHTEITVKSNDLIADRQRKKETIWAQLGNPMCIISVFCVVTFNHLFKEIGKLCESKFMVL